MVHVNRKRFDAESNLISGSKNKKCQQPLRGVACLAGATAWPAAGIPPHASRTDDTTFAEQAKMVVRALCAGSLCRMSKERAENG